MSGGNQIIEDEIIIGDKVDLVTRKGAVHRTMIEDKLETGAFLAGVPNIKGIYMPVEENDDLYLVFYRSSGRFIAQMKVVALENRGEIRYMWLMQKSTAQKNQRREAYRLPVSFEVQIFDIPEDTNKGSTDDAEKAADKVADGAADEAADEAVEEAAEEAKAVPLEVGHSRDLSVTGVALITKKKYEPGDNYLLSLHLERTPTSYRSRSINEETAPDFQLTATVRRCIPWRTTNSFNTGMQFYGMTESMSDGIAKFVLSEQQKQIKRRRIF